MFERVTRLGNPLSCLEISGLFQMVISLHGISEENKQIPPWCQGGVHGKVFKVVMLSSNERQISVLDSIVFLKLFIMACFSIKIMRCLSVVS